MTTERIDTVRGLSTAAVNDRIKRGLTNAVPDAPSRTVEEILRANIFTRFNLLLSVLLLVIVFVAPIQDALFGIVLVVNTAIGIIQELRAKATLDRLALLSAPKATVVREGGTHVVEVSGVVLDDIVEIKTGDQIVVDGVIVATDSIEVDESLLTGESDSVRKTVGDECLSGSFVVAGSARMRATKVGTESYAVRLSEQARRFTLVRSELRSGIDWLLGAIGWIIIPTMSLLVWSQLTLDAGVRPALRGAVAGAVGMVPQGLVLLTSVAFAVSVVRLGRRNVLVKELPSVEGLARVDVVCFDKTGTLTEGRLAVQDVIQLDPAVDFHAALGSLAAVDENPNPTQAAIASGFPDSPWRALDVVPFSSKRKWSGAALRSPDGVSTWILGAPEIVAGGSADVLDITAQHTKGGKRVVVLARSNSKLSHDVLPSGLVPVAVVTLGDRIRKDAAATLRYFAEQGVAAKVISGDHPDTVAAIAREVGLPGSNNPVDARTLPTTVAELATIMDDVSVFGRVSPQQKRLMVQALQLRGHVVAMTGDGVNDVLALKDSDIGIAVGSGSSASRAVAQLVLLDGKFESLPGVVAEGRRVISNIERVANLFVTKTVYAVAIALMVGLAGRAFPFLPRHLTLVGSITIGIPGFFLALEPSARRARSGFVKRVMRFALPTGIAAGLATFAAYEIALSETDSLIEAQTMATLVLAAIGLFALVIVSRPLTTLRRLLVGGMAALLALTFLSDSTRTFFALELPRIAVLFAGVGIVAITGSAMYATLRLVGWRRQGPILPASSDLPLPERLQLWWAELRAEPERLWRQDADEPEWSKPEHHEGD
ncbi:MAG: HAD-IC family P-type ATPase [Acidimicrobiia bacterium]|nr:HAD-IC family P-type ATPase [Acidimicrobiia bacterium]